MANKQAKSRSVRIPSDLWQRFKDACDANFTNRTEKINEFIQAYVHKYEMRTGYISDEMSEALEREIDRLVKKHSVVLLTKILQAVGKGSITQDELTGMLDADNSDLTEYL